jgi:hypothetical protein
VSVQQVKIAVYFDNKPRASLVVLIEKHEDYQEFLADLQALLSRYNETGKTHYQ